MPVCGFGDVAEQNALRIILGCAPEASACDTAGASAVIRIASNPRRLPNLRTRRRRMRLTLASKAAEPPIMPREDASVCALAGRPFSAALDHEDLIFALHKRVPQRYLTQPLTPK